MHWHKPEEIPGEWQEAIVYVNHKVSGLQYIHMFWWKKEFRFLDDPNDWLEKEEVIAWLDLEPPEGQPKPPNIYEQCETQNTHFPWTKETKPTPEVH